MSIDNKTFTILLVDDREENLISLEDILEAENRVFLKATSGNEALRLALKNEQIGLIMLDVQMPEMDGFEVARLLKSNTKTRDISIIFVTAISKEEQYVLQGFGEGAVDYLQKPLDINVTKAKVNVFERLYFFQDELKRSLEEKDKVNKQLERFMYVVAHDLKSPLNGVNGLLTMLKEDERTDASKIAAIGYCFGGTGVLELARSGAEVAGVVSFHGGLDSAPGFAAEKGKVPAKVLVLHGAIDPKVPAEQVSAFEKEFNEAGADWQLVAYSGAVHAFTQKMAGSDISTGVAYDAAADRRSWEAMKVFFAEIFGTTPAK